MTQFWGSFWSALLATFLGVLLSVSLSAAVYWWRHRQGRKKQAKETQHALLEDLEHNNTCLKWHSSHINQLRNKRQLILKIGGRLWTASYDGAFQSGSIRLIGDTNMQKNLGNYFYDCRDYNAYLDRYENFAALAQNIAKLPASELGKTMSDLWYDPIIEWAEDQLKRTTDTYEKVKALK